MAEIELHVLMGQCLNLRISTIKEMQNEVPLGKTSEITKKLKSTCNLPMTKQG
jgi:hypothetical protein